MAVPLIDITQKILNPTLEALSNAGATTDHAAWLRRPGNAAKLVIFMQETMQDELRAQVPVRFEATVVYIQPEYDDLKRRFPADAHEFKGLKFEMVARDRILSKSVRFEFVQMPPGATTDAVLCEMELRGLRPATFEELLGFAAKYPEEQRRNKIVAIGSTVIIDGQRNVPYLWYIHRRGRCLRLDLLANIWNGNFVFLAVRKDA